VDLEEQQAIDARYDTNAIGNDHCVWSFMEASAFPKNRKKTSA
jgi:hypothetical protein